MTGPSGAGRAGSDAPMTVGYTLLDAFERVGENQPDAVALHCGQSSWTFADLRTRAASVAAGLRDAGVEAGDRIALLADNCHKVAELYWAACIAGAISVPLEARLAEDETAAILDDVRPTVVVADHKERLDLLADLATDAPVRISLGGSASNGTSYEELTEGAQAPIEAPRYGADTPVALFHTAAVEGRPRGAVLTHRNLVNQVVQTGNGFGISPDDLHGVFLPLSHTFGAYLLFVSTCRGAGNTLLPTFDPEGAAHLVGEGKVTFFAEFAPMAERIHEVAEAEGIDLGGQLRFVTGLDTPPTVETYLDAGARWFNLYGQTETSGIVAMGEVHAGEADAKDAYSGRALELTRISLRDEDGEVVPEGQAGEAWVRSDCVVTRYWPDEPTRLTDGWLRTGDVLRAESDRQLWFVGRTGDKDLIKPGGQNVYPAEVEQTLTRHDGVEQAFAFGVPDPEWRERVAVVVVPAEGAEPDEADLLALCEQHLASYKHPKALIVAPELRDSDESLDRSAIHDRYGDRAEAMAQEE